MAYLPKNKYKKLYTKGTEYRLVSTGEPYIGEYLKLNDGRLFAGSDPSDIKGKLIPLTTPRNNNVLSNTKNNVIYSILKKDLSAKQDSYIPILSSKPTPTAVDYSNNYFNRYISVRLNTKEYQEISKDVYVNFNKRKYNTTLNKVFFVKWDLGSDSELTNSKRLRQMEYDLPGIFNFFPNKGEYGIVNGVIYIGNSKIYPNGEAVPKELPRAYQLGNKNPNSIENTNVPQNQYCGNCVFYQKGNCSKWNAEVRNEYYCRAYKGKSNQKAPVDSPTSSPLPPTPSEVQSPTPLPTPISTPSYGGGGGGGY